MKHIVHVSNDFEPTSGGINTHLKNLLQCLGKMGFQVTLLVPTASNEKSEGILVDAEGGTKSFKVVRSFYKQTIFKPLKLSRLTQSTRAGLEWIGKRVNKIDLIHQHDLRATRLGATIFGAEHQIPVIWTNHSSDYFNEKGFLTSVILNLLKYNPHEIIAVHRLMAELIEESEYVDIPVRYIPNGVNVDHFAPDDRCNKEKTIVFFPQRMVSLKGAEILAKAAHRILHNYQNKEISFWFAGSEIASNRNARTIRKVKKILKDFTGTDAVKFLGNPTYEEMPWYYSCADIVVLPLQVETENISVFEAWASGTPLITTYQVEKNGYMINEENCLIVPENDPGELAETILSLSIDMDLREKLAANGRAIVEEQFTWGRAALDTAELYREILKKTGHEVSIS